MFFDPGGVSGRYVKVQLLTTDCLHIAEFEDFGVPPGSPVTPEPLRMILLGTGLAGGGAARRRKRGAGVRA